MIAVCLIWLVTASGAYQDASPLTAVYTDEPWDVDGPCQIYVEKLSVALSEMVMCAANYTIPPKVCTNCIEKYIHYRQVEYDTKTLTKVRARDNTTCSQVIYQNYLLSYVSDLADAINEKIWSQSRCHSCISVAYDFENSNTTYTYLPQTLSFSVKLEEYRRCISNYTSEAGDLIEDPQETNVSAVCRECEHVYQELYKYYWRIYVDPDVEFCVDVETTMNDTVHLWRNVWGCPDHSTKKDDRDAKLVLISAAILLVLTLFFYAASYIQGEGEARKFIRYSRLEASTRPQSTRARLISNSSSDANIASRVVESDMRAYTPTLELKMSGHKEEPLEANVDQLTQYRERCADHVAVLKTLLEECNDRVNSRQNTEETCHQEMCDYVHHLDQYAMPKAFKALK